MGKKVFISYAEEDTTIALVIIARLKKIGLSVHYWQDPKGRGGRFLKWIKESIPAADAFLVLLSESYQKSDYCQRELEMAIPLEKDKVSQFIYVALVGAIDPKKPGFEGAYDRFDLLKKNKEYELQQLENKLSGCNGGESPPQLPDTIYQPSFQNRVEELDELTSNLTRKFGSVHFWQFVAPVKMGKTWFLNKLSEDLLANDRHWEIHRVDLLDSHSTDLMDVSKLLMMIFDKKIEKPITKRKLTTIARHIGLSENHWLCILDNAELISDEIATDLRTHLNTISGLLKKNRLAFVAASRRIINPWLGVIPLAPRFNKRMLSPFTIDVIEEAVYDFHEKEELNQGVSWVSDIAERLYRTTEGLPALLVLYLDWIKRNVFIFEPDDIESDEVFNELARPYVDNFILSVDSLIPMSENSSEKQREALSKILKGICGHRRFVGQYLYEWLQNESAIEASMKSLGWKNEDLMDIMKGTYIVDSRADDLWTVFYRSLRRLLFRYFYPETSDRAAVHMKALDFYQNRWEGWTGTDKAIVMVENLWHFIEYNRLSGSTNIVDEIIDFTDDMLNNGTHPDTYSVREIIDLIERRMLEDKELQETIQQVDSGLSHKLPIEMKRIISSKPGGVK